ncbi:hypothetical protein FACS1894142_2570 [Spirochaetia bacterium]|nr:hypothetical protein FACS1894142_2570 [Spirochaetia bacterium]
MSKKSVIITACLLASVLSVASLSAQDIWVDDNGAGIPGFGTLPAPVSNTNRATAGQIDTDVDKFQSVLDWSDVAFSKWFGYAGIVPNNNWLLELGYATKVGGIYLGAYYSGRIADGYSKKTDEIVQTNENINGEYVKTGQKDTSGYEYGQYWEWNANGGRGESRYYQRPESTSLNNASVLVGLGNIGIKVGFFETLRTYAAPDAPAASEGGYTNAPNSVENTTSENGFTSTKELNNYKNIEGNLIPSVSFGMPLKLGSLVLKPTATIAVNIRQDAVSFDVVGDDSNNDFGNFDPRLGGGWNVTVDKPNTTNGPQITQSYERNFGYVQPDIALGAALEFPKNGTASTGVGLAYRTAFNIYAKPGEFGEDIGAGTFAIRSGTKESKDSAYTETVTKSKVDAYESSYWNNLITPSFSYTNELSEKVTFGLSAEVAFITGLSSNQRKETEKKETTRTFYNETTSGYNFTETDTRTREGRKESTTWFGIAPAIDLGVGYQINERWNLHGGLDVTLPQWNTTQRVTGPDKGSESSWVKTYSNGETNTSSNIWTGDDSGNTVDTRTVESWWTSLNANYNLGFSFAFTPKLVLDTRVGLGGVDNGWQNINWTSPSYALSLTGSF